MRIKLKIFYLVFFLSNCLLLDVNFTFSYDDNDSKEYAESWNIIYISLDNAITLWDSETQQSYILYKTESYNTVVQPALCFENRKLLFAINSGKGEIILYDIENKSEEIVYSGGSVWGLSLSPDNKLIAFLSEFDIDHETCALFILNLETKNTYPTL